MPKPNSLLINNIDWPPRGPALKRAFRKVRVDNIEIGKVILSSGTTEVLSVKHEVKQNTLTQTSVSCQVWGVGPDPYADGQKQEQKRSLSPRGTP